MVAAPADGAQIRVRVWFGQHVIADYTACRELAEPYAHAMSRRFAGLRVTARLTRRLLHPVRGSQRGLLAKRIRRIRPAAVALMTKWPSRLNAPSHLRASRPRAPQQPVGERADSCAPPPAAPNPDGTALHPPCC
jgi:hypothetical protein